MKRFWIGLILFSVLLILGGAVTWSMQEIHTPIAALLQTAQQAAMESNWRDAVPLAEQAHRQWQHWYTFTAAFADHAPMDDISSLFAELEVYAFEQDSAHFCALCGNLRQLADAMAESHRPTWWNFL